MSDHKIVEEAINAFYRSAGVNFKFNGSINEDVAKVFGKMLRESQRCSNALVWVPRPSGGIASISWIARNFTRSIILKLKHVQFSICTQRTILGLRSDMYCASAGL